MPKTWVAIRYSLPKDDRSSAYKKLFGYSWTERKKAYTRSKRVGSLAAGVDAFSLRKTGKVFREYQRGIHADLDEIPHSRLGKGVILVPPSHASRAVRILKSRGCTVSVARGITSSQEQYQASNAYFLGQWRSYLSALEGLLASAGDNDRAIQTLQLALGLSERFLKDVRALPVPSVPEDIEALSMKLRIEEALKAFTTSSEARVSALAGLRKDVETQLKVLREQGKAVLAAL